VVKKPLLIIILLIWLMAGLAAQNKVSISSSVNKQTLYQSDLLIYNLRISSSSSVPPEEPSPPIVSGLRFHNQSSSRESRTSIVNGRLEATASVTYSYYYYPTRSGKITIPSQSVRVGRGSYRTDPITVEVKPDISPPQGRTSPSRPQTPSPSYDPFASFYPGAPEPEGESHILCLPESQTVFRSEPAIVSYYLYTTEDVRSLNLTEERDFDGYGKAIYEQPNNLEFDRVEYQGRSFRRSLLKRLVLYPHSTGVLKAPEMVGSIRLMTFMYQNRNLRSKPASITVRDLPSGAPAGFGGAIGSFNITEKLSTSTVKLGEAVIYTVQISGQGNFSQFTAPVLASDARVQISSPQVKDQLNAGTKGTRILQYTIIPRVKADIRLPGFKFSWLDSATGSYMTFTGLEDILSVKAGSAGATAPQLDKMLDQLTMLPMIPSGSYPPQVPWHLRWWWWLLAGLMLLSLPFSAASARHKKMRLLDPEGWRDRNATAAFHTQLAEAKAAAAKHSPDFHHLAGSALSGYLRDKYELPAHLGSDELITELSGKGLSPNLLEEIRSFLADVQTAQYAPSADLESSIGRDLERLIKISQALKDPGARP